MAIHLSVKQLISDLERKKDKVILLENCVYDGLDQIPDIYKKDKIEEELDMLIYAKQIKDFNILYYANKGSVKRIIVKNRIVIELTAFDPFYSCLYKHKPNCDGYTSYITNEITAYNVIPDEIDKYAKILKGRSK